MRTGALTHEASDLEQSVFELSLNSPLGPTLGLCLARVDSQGTWSHLALLTSICRDPYVKRWLEKMRRHEPSLHRHSLRVGRLAADYHSFCGLEYERGWSLIEGALLHDLGKICLDSSVLSKPRFLSDGEKRMIALHPTIGAELLDAQGYFSKVVVNIVRRHHERLDGSGYPNGWGRRRTAKAVRVVAACDALCAMTEDRPYEDAWPVSEAIKRLKAMPKQYDAEIVESLDMMIHERGTTIPLFEDISATTKDFSKRNSGVKRPRSAFYAARSLTRISAA